jgi:hypothetical protein
MFLRSIIQSSFVAAAKQYKILLSHIIHALIHHIHSFVNHVIQSSIQSLLYSLLYLYTYPLIHVKVAPPCRAGEGGCSSASPVPVEAQDGATRLEGRGAGVTRGLRATGARGRPDADGPV